MAYFDAIWDALETDVQAHMDPIAVKFGRGSRAQGARKTPPSVVWVPTRDPYGPRSASLPQSTGVDPATVGAPLATRTASFNAVVWAETTEQVEILCHAIVAALVRAFQGISTVNDGVWELPKNLDRGEQCTLDMSVDVPVTDDVPQSVIIEAFDIDTSGAVAGDGVIESGDQ